MRRMLVLGLMVVSLTGCGAIEPPSGVRRRRYPPKSTSIGEASLTGCDTISTRHAFPGGRTTTASGALLAEL